MIFTDLILTTLILDSIDFPPDSAYTLLWRVYLFMKDKEKDIVALGFLSTRAARAFFHLIPLRKE
jgi:hypothetical protein